MFPNKESKPVDIEIVEHTYVEGKLLEQGTKLRQVPAAVAMELAAAGKARVSGISKAAAKAEKAE